MDYKHFFLLLTFLASINVGLAQQSVEIHTDSLFINYNNCPTPASAWLGVSGEADNYNSATDSVEVIIFWGDGTSDTSVVQLWESGITDYFGTNSINHIYSLAGTYNVQIVATMPNAVADTVSPTNQVVVSTTCITVDGYAYKDLNNNCVLNASDDSLSWQTVTVRDANGGFVTSGVTNSGGYYNIQVPSGQNNLDIEASAWYGLATVCPAAGSYTFNSNVNQSFNFGMDCINNQIDSRVYSNAFIGLAGANGWARASAYVWGCGSIPSPDTLTIILDTSVVSYVAPAAGTPNPDVVNGGEISWYFNYTQSSNSGYNYGYSQTFKIVTLTDTTVQLGDSACFTAEIALKNNDTIPANNTVEYCREVNVAYDPNNKINLPSGIGPLGRVDTSTRTISYRINFQNTGTAPAQNIYIIDTISEHFDLSSMRIYGTSHDELFSFKNLDNRIVRFDFTQIFLPDSASDPEGSKGYIDFEFDLKPNLPIGTSIENTAYIYFDWNAPIITNTAINTLYVAPEDPDQVSLEFFTRDVTCKQNDNGLIDASVWTGTPPYSFLWSNGATTEDLDGLAPGDYTVTVTDANNTTAEYTITLAENRVFDPPTIGTVTGSRTPVGWSTYTYAATLDVNTSFAWEAVGGEVLSTTSNSAEILWKAGPDGQVMVTKTDPFGCTANSTTDVSIDLVGINELERNAINIYPNPNDGFFTLEVMKLIGSERLTVLDMQGRILFEAPINANQTSIDLSELGAGVYNVMIQNDHASMVQRLILN